MTVTQAWGATARLWIGVGPSAAHALRPDLRRFCSCTAVSQRVNATHGGFVPLYTHPVRIWMAGELGLVSACTADALYRTGTACTVKPPGVCHGRGYVLLHGRERGHVP